MSSREVDLPEVVRVKDPDGFGSRIKPMLQPTWSRERQLAWCVAVTAHDTGKSIRLFVNESPKILTAYSFSTGSVSYSSYSFESAWTWLNE